MEILSAKAERQTKDWWKLVTVHSIIIVYH